MEHFAILAQSKFSLIHFMKTITKIIYNKTLLFQCLLLSLIPLFTEAQLKKGINFINPTGTYRLDAKTEIKDGETYGYSGNIKVKLLDSSKIVIYLFVCKGAPSYNSGSFLDTIPYSKNIAIYRTPEEDASCKIILYFTKKGIKVEQYQDNLNYGCSFGHGVFADGYYKKVSSKIPIITEDE